MSQHVLKSLPELMENQVISVSVADKIKEYYKKDQQASTNRLFTIFGSLGALLVGLGLILIIAHNWDDFTRSIKTLIAFVPLLFAQVLTGFSILKNKSQTWRESSSIFLFLTVGACLSMISQIYNISGNLSSFLFTWVLLCAPLIYILKTHALGVLNIIAVTAYAISYGYSFTETVGSPYLYLLLMGFSAPYFIRLFKRQNTIRKNRVFNWLVPLSLVTALGTFTLNSITVSVLLYSMLFGILFLIAKTRYFKSLRGRHNGFLIIGLIGQIAVLLAASSKWFWNWVGKYETINTQALIIMSLFVMLICYLIWNTVKWRFQRAVDFILVIPLLFLIVFFIGFYNDTVPMIFTNILALGFGLVFLKKGLDEHSFLSLNFGLLCVVALICCRFFDLHISFVVRGLIFMIVGTGFLTTNLIIIKHNRTSNR